MNPHFEELSAQDIKFISREVALGNVELRAHALGEQLEPKVATASYTEKYQELVGMLSERVKQLREGNPHFSGLPLAEQLLTKLGTYVQSGALREGEIVQHEITGRLLSGLAELLYIPIEREPEAESAMAQVESETVDSLWEHHLEPDPPALLEGEEELHPLPRAHPREGPESTTLSPAEIEARVRDSWPEILEEMELARQKLHVQREALLEMLARASQKPDFAIPRRWTERMPELGLLPTEHSWNRDWYAAEEPQLPAEDNEAELHRAEAELSGTRDWHVVEDPHPTAADREAGFDHADVEDVRGWYAEDPHRPTEDNEGESQLGADA